MRPLDKTITIVGGGLAGLSLAHGLLSRGVEVTVHEAKHYPRHKVCGEFICGATEDTLKTLGLEDIMDSSVIVHEAQFHNSKGECISAFKLPRPAWGISRWTLEARLAERVRSLGGIILEHQRFNVAQPLSEGTVICHGRTQHVDGALGLKIHIPNTRGLSKLEMHLGRNAYVGISPVEDNQLNVCGLFMNLPQSPQHHRIEFMIEVCEHAGLTILAQQLATSGPIESSFASTTHLAFHQKQMRKDGLYLGDAAMALAPFTGNGMSLALESAAKALAPLTHYATGRICWNQALTQVHEEWEQRFANRLAWSRRLHPWLLHPIKQKWLQWALHSHVLPLQWLFEQTH